jgi:hypothetical protein
MALAIFSLLVAGVPLGAEAQRVEIGGRAGVTSSTVVWETPGPQSSQRIAAGAP